MRSTGSARAALSAWRGSTASITPRSRMNAAAEAFSIRHVCMFGNDVPEGMASLDDIAFGAASASQHRRTAIPRRANFITLRRDAGGTSRGAAHADAGHCRRPRGFSGNGHLARRPHDVGGDAVELCRRLRLDGDLAAVGRLAQPSSSLRRRDAAAARSHAIAARRLVAPAPLALRLGEAGAFADAAVADAGDRALAHAGTGGSECGLDRRAALQRSLCVRRGRPVCRAARRRRCGGAGAAGLAAAPQPRARRPPRARPSSPRKARSHCVAR